MSENIKVTVIIQTSIERVWEGLTNPDLVKQYFFGALVESTWKNGSPIFFRGEWDGKKYEDKGTILSIKPGHHVSYNYWSSMSGTSDLPENYKVISYDLLETKKGTELSITQECDAKTRDHSEKNWKMVLGGLKELLEKASR